MIDILIILVIIGVVLWLIETYVPLSPPIKVIIRVLVILFVAIWLLNMFGITNFNIRR